MFCSSDVCRIESTAWNAKCPICLGNFTPKTSNYCFKNRAPTAFQVGGFCSRGTCDLHESYLYLTPGVRNPAKGVLQMAAHLQLWVSGVDSAGVRC